MTCTTILIGKSATADGSTIVARNEDSQNGTFCPKRFVVADPATRPARYTSVIGHLEVDLPKNGRRYTALPNALLDEGLWEEAGFSIRNVGMSATETLTSNERVLGADPLVAYDPATGTPGGIGEEDMVTLVLPYMRSARDGVRILGELLERHGTYEMNGIAFQDADEIWWMETVGGHHWIARRVPDDCYVVMPNQLGIDDFDLADAEGAQESFMASADLRRWMAENHLDLTAGGDGGRFNPRHAFGSASDADHVYNTPRAWDILRTLNPRDAKELGWGPEDDDLPWCRVPERLLTVEDVRDVLSLHYQGTPFDPYGRQGDERTRGMYRPIGINRNSQLAVLQIRPYEPLPTQAVQWVAYGSNAFNALAPFYANVEVTPNYLANTGATVSTESLWWASRLVAALADPHFGACAPHVERYRMRVGAGARAILAKTDRMVREQGIGCVEAHGPLQDANQQIADLLRAQTDELLDHVLYEASMRMRNGFSRSDG